MVVARYAQNTRTLSPSAELMFTSIPPLQDLIFDKRVLWNHRVLAAVLGVVLRLPPVSQVMASRQVKSRYLEYLIAHVRV